MSSEERRLRQELAKLEAQKEFQDYVESLTESDRRDLLALYYLGRGAARTLKGARTRIRGYKVEHIPWALMQSAKLDNRLEEGIRIYSRGKFDLYPPTKGRKAKGSSPPRGAKIPDAQKKACQLAPDPVFAHPELRLLASMLEKFISGEERTDEHVESIRREFDRREGILPDFTALWFALLIYTGSDDVDSLVSECRNALSFRRLVGED